MLLPIALEVDCSFSPCFGWLTTDIPLVTMVKMVIMGIFTTGCSLTPTIIFISHFLLLSLASSSPWGLPFSAAATAAAHLLPKKGRSSPPTPTSPTSLVPTMSWRWRTREQPSKARSYLSTELRYVQSTIHRSDLSKCAKLCKIRKLREIEMYVYIFSSKVKIFVGMNTLVNACLWNISELGIFTQCPAETGVGKDPKESDEEAVLPFLVDSWSCKKLCKLETQVTSGPIIL